MNIEKLNRLNSLLAEFKEYIFASGNILDYTSSELLDYQKEVKDYALRIEKLTPIHEGVINDH